MIVTKRAFNDMAKARDWYNAQSTGLGSKFLAAVHDAFERIEARPTAFPAVIPPARRLNLHRFPYGVWYVADPDIVILAVVHHRQNPASVLEALQP